MLAYQEDVIGLIPGDTGSFEADIRGVVRPIAGVAMI